MFKIPLQARYGRNFVAVLGSWAMFVLAVKLSAIKG